MNHTLPELLSPAGTYEKMCTALHFGADAVYLAGEKFGMRAAAGNFDRPAMQRAVEYAHQKGKKVYVALNTMPGEGEIRNDLSDYLDFLDEIHPDAVIAASLGVMRECRVHHPNLAIHASTQTGCVNSYDCLSLYQLGAKRIVLARELSLKDIEAIRRAIPDDLELEVFVHGSMCVSFSGRCMLSQYYTGRDANRGACTQPCRWQYRFYEEKRPEDVLTAEIHPEGTYLFGSKDLCMIDHLKELKDIGVSSLKIEGRMKSAYYTAVTTNTYRIALQKLNGEYLNITSELLHRELDSVAHRQYCTGYFFDTPQENPQLAENSGYQNEKAYLCLVERIRADGKAVCRQKNKFSVSDACAVLTPGKTAQRIAVIGMYDENDHPIDTCPHPQSTIILETDIPLNAGDIIRRA